MRTTDGECRRRHLLVAIDRRSRWVHLCIRDDAVEVNALGFPDEVAAAFPFRLRRVLTDRGSCFVRPYVRL